jgi:serine protease AprX
MATKKSAGEEEGQQPGSKLDRKLMEQLMFGTGRVRRFTQDSPVLPDVWLEYARVLDPDEERQTHPTDPGTVKLLLTPFRETSTGEVAKELRSRLGERTVPGARAAKARVIYNQSIVAATLSFEDLVRVVLPMTAWWEQLDKRWNIEGAREKSIKDAFAEAVQDPEHPQLILTGEKKGEKRRPQSALLWMIRVVGALALAHRGESLPPIFYSSRGAADAKTADWRALVGAALDLIDGVTPGLLRARIFSVNLNREATPTVDRSVLAVKADAARLLFNISCRDIAWAVIDSGIDARHPAFRLRQDDEKKTLLPSSFKNSDGKTGNGTRILGTYDFTQIDYLLDPDPDVQPEHLKRLLKSRSQKAQELQEELQNLKASLASGRSIDWGLIAPLLRIPQDQGEHAYGASPAIDHGTHVAGILAADWRATDSAEILEEDLIGVCPDVRLYDLRVLDADGRGDEFSVMAALQFIRHFNATNDYMAVHGVNLSLSIPHDVANYACGRTPVCDECERVVSSGVAVVAAAGNQGYRKFTAADGQNFEVYNSVSITDPGNADAVITVGATHRFRPHTYGVSYFSSRGPTGDGRLKPDLVAPGEKITAPLPDEAYGLKDGTSMAAPHVSGVAALLMARHNELLGRPARIKQILCATATDLGRERYFQGAGMLDALRALQSV